MTGELEAARRQLGEQGFCVISGALGPSGIAEVRAALARAVTEMGVRGLSTHNPRLDPNAHSIRVARLPEFDPIFVELLRHPLALALTGSLLGPDFLVSNFSANTALPGALPMRVHSDQALVMPPPWTQPLAINIIWCLDDVHAANGATRYLPGSHLFRSLDDVPADAEARTCAFEAPAGALIAMDGRLWHTSGANVTADQARAMLFAYYSIDYLRQQVNWDVALSPDVREALDPEMRALLGMGMLANIRQNKTLIYRE